MLSELELESEDPDFVFEDPPLLSLLSLLEEPPDEPDPLLPPPLLEDPEVGVAGLLLEVEEGAADDLSGNRKEVSESELKGKTTIQRSLGAINNLTLASLRGPWVSNLRPSSDRTPLRIRYPSLFL